MANASVHDLKVAICPTCGATRLFFDVAGKPVPLGSSLLEAKNIRDDKTQFAQATGYTSKSITDDLAVWEENEHAGKVVDIMYSEDSGITESATVESNTITTLVLEKSMRGKHRLPVGSVRPRGLFDDANLPFYNIRESDVVSSVFREKVKKKLWDSKELICDKCRTQYTVP